MKILLISLSLILIFDSCKTPERKKSVIVATNSWTAAYARTAGAKDVVVLAPFDMTHPSEYELRATDIPTIMNAKMVIFAGYETMVNRLQKGLNLQPGVLVKIETDYKLSNIEKSVLRIAKVLGTEKIAIQNLDSIRKCFKDGRLQFSKPENNSKLVLVNFFQRSFVEEMGFEVAGVFGPAALEASDISKLAKKTSVLIVDNEHSPVGQPLVTVQPTSRYTSLLNFPGLYQTSSIEDVIKHNIKQLQSARQDQ
jgi:zinc transport system substrate-binding protein